jgi:hypothetical protein
MALKLSYCQLIKIILTKIGGSPLQQVYTQLSQGLQQITKGGLIPTELQQLKTYIDQVTTALNGISGDVNAMQQLTQQFFYNPVGTVTTELITKINQRLAQIEDPMNPNNPLSGNEAEWTSLSNLKTQATSFKTHTDTLAGVTEPSTTGGFGGCTLADLLGDGCKPAEDAPDVDLQVIVDGFKSGAIITALKTNIEAVIANQTGYAQISSAITNLKNSLDTFNLTVTSKLNKIIIKRAVETYITDIAFKLLSGCSSGLIDSTIRPEAKTAITPFVEYQQRILAGTINADGSAPGANDTILAT